MEGIPHCHILMTGWSEHISIPVLLIALQVYNILHCVKYKMCPLSLSLYKLLQALLSSPELDDRYIVNSSASEMLQKTPHAYHQMTKDCVTASLRVNGE